MPPPNSYIKPDVKPVGVYKVKLQIGKHEFIGNGNTNQVARHDAALKALTQIKNEEKNENIKEVLKCMLNQINNENTLYNQLLANTIYFTFVITII